MLLLYLTILDNYLVWFMVEELSSSRKSRDFCFQTSYSRCSCGQFASDVKLQVISCFEQLQVSEWGGGWIRCASDPWSWSSDNHCTLKSQSTRKRCLVSIFNVFAHVSQCYGADSGIWWQVQMLVQVLMQMLGVATHVWAVFKTPVSRWLQGLYMIVLYCTA